MERVSIEIVKYNSTFETGWLYCRVLAFLKTAYFNDVLTSKPTYKNQAIELVALDGDTVAGLLDIEIEAMSKEICSREKVRSGMIHHIAVHPDYQRKNIGRLMLSKAESELKNNKIQRLEAWTRDDQWVRAWYTKNQFHSFYSYLHVRIEGAQLCLKDPSLNVRVVSGFGHYEGPEKEKIRAAFPNSQECIGFQKLIE